MYAKNKFIFFSQALIHGLNRHYYSISINYRKNELEQQMLMNLNKKSWIDGLTLRDYNEHCNLNTVSKLNICGFLLYLKLYSCLLYLCFTLNYHRELIFFFSSRILSKKCCLWLRIMTRHSRKKKR